MTFRGRYVVSCTMFTALDISGCRHKDSIVPQRPTAEARTEVQLGNGFIPIVFRRRSMIR